MSSTKYSEGLKAVMSDSGSSSSERERDWQSIVEELKRQKAKVKMLQGKLVDKEKSSADETRSPRRSPVQKTWNLQKIQKHKRKRDTFQLIRHEMRKVQNITGCTTRTLNCTLQHLQPFLIGCVHISKKKFVMKRIRARKQSTCKRLLHGCIGCNNYVFGPKEQHIRCPLCGHDRYKGGTRQPNEVCVWVVCVWVWPNYCF